LARGCRPRHSDLDVQATDGGRWWSVLLVLVACAAAPAAAQRVEGRIVSAADSAPVVAALVVLLDGGGARVARVGTGPDGTFSVAAATPGRYVVAVLRIGQRPWRSAALELDTGAVRRVTFTVPDDPIILDAIAVEARSSCRTSPAEGSTIGTLLAEADRALTLTRLAMEARGMSSYVVVLYRRTLSASFEPIDSTVDLQTNLSWPIRTLSPERLAADGFVRTDAATPDRPLGGTTYFGLDATVLLSSWFLSTHCFGVSEGSGPDSDAVIVTFRPEGGHRPDVRGRLVVARTTLELRRIEWTYVRLPRWVVTDGAGGGLTLERLSTGVYVPSRWWLRAPVPEIRQGPAAMARGGVRNRESVRLWGWSEAGGSLVLRH
jgi:hypothetical protein